MLLLRSYPIENVNYIQNELLNIIQNEDQLKGKAIKLNDRLVEDLLLDSLGMLSLVCLIENHFKIQLDDNWENPPQTVEDLIYLIDHKLEKH